MPREPEDSKQWWRSSHTPKTKLLLKVWLIKTRLMTPESGHSPPSVRLCVTIYSSTISFYSLMFVHVLICIWSPNWEARHGAAIGLREVLRKHGSGAGKTLDAKSEAELDAQNTAFLDDCAIRLLCVFALDRFCDFVSDQVPFSIFFSLKLLNCT